MTPIDLDKRKYPNDYYEKLAKVEDAIDTDCVKEKLNLPEFGDKTLLDVEADILIASAKSKCIKIDPIAFADLFVNFAAWDYESSDCARHKLHELEPTSKLAQFTRIDKKLECKNYSSRLDPYRTYRYEASIGRLNESTCGVLNKENVDIISHKTLLISLEKDEELKKIEMKERFALATEKLHKLADCVLERLK